MRSWVFRHRHELRSVYGLPPEPSLAERGRARRPARRELVAAAAPEPPRRARGRTPVFTLRPHRRGA